MMMLVTMIRPRPAPPPLLRACACPQVAALLWHLVVVQSDLLGHLSAIKDYFLLARGEFFHSFLVEARRIMALPPRPATADADINIPFQQSALKSSAQHDRTFSRFRIRWSQAERKEPVASHLRHLLVA